MSVLRDALKEYVLMRRSFGTMLHEPANTLNQFVDFLEEEGSDFITTDLALRWAIRPVGVQRATWARRLSMIRLFARWWSTFDSRTEVPPCGILRAARRRRKPYIFTDLEVEAIMAEAACLRSPRGLRALSHVTLFGLLSSTGLRPGEALALDRDDVDLHSGVLTVRETKFGKSRFVPVEESTRTALANYADRRDHLDPKRQTAAFLVSERGTRLPACASRRTFIGICCTVGLRAELAQGRIGPGPRLQDFRHTFVTRRLVEWYRAGLDVEREMPKLVTYLGHAEAHRTYWYIEAIPELLQLATNRLVAQEEEEWHQ